MNTEITDGFIVDETPIGKAKRFLPGMTDIVENPREPIMCLISEERDVRFLQGVKPGEFVIRKGQDEKSILLSPNKLLSFNYMGKKVRGWIVYENNPCPLPEDPLYVSDMFRKITQKLAMNWRDREEAKMFEGKGKMWLYILVGAAIFLWFLSSMDLSGVIGSGGVEQAASTTIEAVKQNITNIPKVVVQ